jgi:peptidyl-prolyl cis-trans isomerase A (cyclophilin A)
MKNFALFLACGATFAAPALAQPAPSAALSAESPAPKEDLVPVALETSLGRIVVALDRGRAPVSTANFLRYVDAKRYDGESFYRAMKVTGGEGGLIQGGIRTDSRKLYPPIAHEPTSKTGIKNVAGTISMARLEPGSARADFFILTADIPSFDAGDASDPDGYAAFGHVVEGMDVVNKIFAAPTDPNKGEGVMRGQLLEPPVKILKAARVK